MQFLSWLHSEGAHTLKGRNRSRRLRIPQLRSSEERRNSRDPDSGRQARLMRFHATSATFSWRLLILIPAFFCLSCSGGGKYNPTHGKVLYNNEPIEGVVVTFHPQRKEKLPDLPFGVTREDGTFEVLTGKSEG